MSSKGILASHAGQVSEPSNVIESESVEDIRLSSGAIGVEKAALANR